MPSPNQLQLAPFFCDKKAHMHSELSYINKKRVSAWLKFPTGSKINTRLSLNFTPSCSTEREVELRGLPSLQVLGAAAQHPPPPRDAHVGHLVLLPRPSRSDDADGAKGTLVCASP